MIKTCPKCKRNLELDETNFFINKTRKNGFQSTCKQCSQQYTKEARPKKVRHKYCNRQQLLIYLRKKHGCIFCGPMPIECIEFHHIDPTQKEGLLSRITNRQLYKELLKCVTVCANCHHKIHYGTLQCPQSSNINIDDIIDYNILLSTRPRKKIQHNPQLMLPFDEPAQDQQISVEYIKIGSKETFTTQLMWPTLKQHLSNLYACRT